LIFAGAKLFPTLPKDASLPYKFVRMIFQCTGGGIIVPIFINAVPVPLAQDAYPVAIVTAFLLHEFAPILRDIMNKSAVFKTAMTILFEAQRASVVVKLTMAAATAIAPSELSFPVFGPIFCGTIAGCGGAFLPLDKGLEPIKAGLAQPMLSAFIAATSFHLFMNTSLSDGVVDAKNQCQIAVALFFIAYGFYSNILDMLIPASSNKKTTEAKIKSSTGQDDDTSIETSEDDESAEMTKQPKRTKSKAPAKRSKKKAA
jgi:hypothetical protein